MRLQVRPPTGVVDPVQHPHPLRAQQDRREQKDSHGTGGRSGNAALAVEVHGGTIVGANPWTRAAINPVLHFLAPVLSKRFHVAQASHFDFR